LRNDYNEAARLWDLGKEIGIRWSGMKVEY